MAAGARTLTEERWRFGVACAVNLRWWSMLAVSLAVTAALVALMLPGQDWVETVRWAAARRAQIERARTPCALLDGEPVAGDAAAALARAARLGADVPAALAARVESLRERGLGGPLAADDRAAVGAFAPAAAAWREAARAATGRGVAPDADALGLLPVFAAMLVSARDPDASAAAAVGTWLDALACAVDLAGCREPLWHALGVHFAEGAVDTIDDGSLGRLPAPELARLATGLERADGALRPASELPAAILVALVERLDGDAPLEPLELGMRDVWIAWRHGFSVRQSGIARAIALAAEVRRFEREVPLDAPWAERAPRLTALAAFDAQHNRDLAFPFLTAIVEQEHARRRTVAKLRLLRLAIAIRTGADPGVLVDPLANAPLVAEAHGADVSCRAPSGAGERRVPRAPGDAARGGGPR